MSDRFRALLITREGDKQTVAETMLSMDDLMAGEVTIAVSHSTVNYKDGLALTGRSSVVRRFPMIPGVDLAGIVTHSASPAFHEGERVLVNGFGLGETHYGGYAGCARVKGEWVLRVPEPFSCADAMAIGTAGYTAMLAVLALEEAGITPEKGPVLVTGAAGGVGSVAVALLAKLGYRVIASTGREDEAAYLSGLGADEVISRKELQGEPRPLAKERWAGAIDNVGSTILANVLSTTSRGGAVAACGLAQGLDLPTSVAPFILRGVSLLGIESVHMNMPRRRAAWERLARDLDPKRLATMIRTIGFQDLPGAADEIMAGRIRGRLVVDIAA
jgi:acrylyl-CoA reductase (NADPH)